MTDRGSEAEKPGRHLVQATPMRKAIARRMSQSKQQAPHFYLSCEVVMDAALEAAAVLNASRAPGERITLTAMMLKAVALTLEEEPEFNAHWTEAGHELIDAINIGVAIDVPAGLIAPAIVACAQLDVAELSSRLKDLAERCGASENESAFAQQK